MDNNLAINIMDDMVVNNETSDIIKVVGVGGGGCNAIAHIYRQGIKGITSLVCNTDRQSLLNNPVPTKLQLGTQGLGAGNQPDIAEELANTSAEDIKKALSDGTEMVFITAGMGGGTGTGAAPVVAKIARELGILTVGIVTLPFLFEGKNKIKQAFGGLTRLKNEVDALLVINNEVLCAKFGNMTRDEAFAKADDTLLTAAQGITDIVVQNGKINPDFADVKRTLKDGGNSIISIGYGEGADRMRDAFKDAMTSVLISNTNVLTAKRILFYLTYSHEHQPRMEEWGDLNDIKEQFNEYNDDFDSTKWGDGEDEELGERIKVTLLLSDVKDVESNDFENLYEYYYGELDTTERKANIYLFNEDTLQDEEIIALVEETPTFERTRQQLAQISNH